jgi:hypothetical protein
MPTECLTSEWLNLAEDSMIQRQPLGFSLSAYLSRDQQSGSEKPICSFGVIVFQEKRTMDMTMTEYG